MEELQKKIEELFEAKKAVQACLNDQAVSVNLHGLAFWAGEVERLREEIKKAI